MCINVANLTEEDISRIEERMSGTKPLIRNNSPKRSQRLRHAVTIRTAEVIKTESEIEARAERRRIEEKLKAAPGSFRRHYHRQLQKAIKTGAPIPKVI